MSLVWLEALLPLGIIGGMLCVMGNAQYYIHKAAHGRVRRKMFFFFWFWVFVLNLWSFDLLFFFWKISAKACWKWCVGCCYGKEGQETNGESGCWTGLSKILDLDYVGDLAFVVLWWILVLFDSMVDGFYLILSLDFWVFIILGLWGLWVKVDSWLELCWFLSVGCALMIYGVNLIDFCFVFGFLGFHYLSFWRFCVDGWWILFGFCLDVVLDWWF